MKGMMKISLLFPRALFWNESELEPIDFLHYLQLSMGCASCETIPHRAPHPSAEAAVLGQAMSISSAERLRDDLVKCTRKLLADSKRPNSPFVEVG